MSCCLCSAFLCVGLAVGSILLFFRFYIKVLAKPCTSYTCMVGKTVIVTGANTGIGYYAALDFAKRGAQVILACRNEDKAIEAQTNIVKATGNDKVCVKIVDFQSFASIRTFCKDICANFDQIDVLVNNAGAAGLKARETKDGSDVTWQTNYFAPFLLTILLLDKIKQSSPSRIVNVASMMAGMCNITLENLHLFEAHNIYSWTKLANVLFARELARRLNGTQVSVYALHPGAVYTDIWRRLPKWVLIWWIPTMKFIYKSSEEGAQTTIYCSVAKECANESGKLYAECGEIDMYKSCKDMDFAKQLFDKTMDIIKLEANERV